MHNETNTDAMDRILFSAAEDQAASVDFDALKSRILTADAARKKTPRLIVRYASCAAAFLALCVAGFAAYMSSFGAAGSGADNATGLPPAAQEPQTAASAPSTETADDMFADTEDSAADALADPGASNLMPDADDDANSQSHSSVSEAYEASVLLPVRAEASLLPNTLAGYAKDILISGNSTLTLQFANPTRSFTVTELSAAEAASHPLLAGECTYAYASDGVISALYRANDTAYFRIEAVGFSPEDFETAIINW